MFLEHIPRRKTGFTLIELLIGISIFSVIVIIVSSLFITSFRLNQEVAIREQLYSDARFTLERLAAAIRSGTIDYEEYFNRTVRDGAYGENYGWYKRQFYSPGDDGAYGSLCNNGAVWTPGVSCVIQKESRDTNSGRNSYVGHAYINASDNADEISSKIKTVNALCGFNEFDDLTVTPGACDEADSPDAPSFAQDELYIISADGKEKTMFIREQISVAGAATEVNALSMLKMAGRDTNGDVFPDTFACSENFDCGTNGNPEDSDTDTDATGVLQDFVPITPNRLNVRNITFYIAPLENPFYAFSETDREIQHLPFVTILLTVEPSPQAGVNVQQFRMTLQETVSTGLLRSAPAPIPGQFDERVSP